MSTPQTSSNNLNHTISQRTDSYWAPPKSFSIANEDGAGIIKIAFTCHKQIPQPFSSTPMNVEESLALSAWEDDTRFDIREKNSMDKDSNFGYSSYNDTVNSYDDDAGSVTTCSTTTTATTTTSSNYPSVVHVTLADLIKIQERRKSMQENINSCNMAIDTTSSVIKKQKIVNFKDEIMESPVESSKNSVDLSPPSIISNDSSTIKDHTSSHQEEISIAPSLGIPKITQEEFEIAKLDKQKKLIGWVKCLWPQLKLPSPRQVTSRLNPRALSRRNLNPLTIGTITTQKSVPMILTAIVKGTNHVNNGIGKNGQIKFIGNPSITKAIYDPREYLLLHCPTYYNPPYYNGDPRIPWTEHFLLNKVLPRLANEATRIQNEVGLYLTVKETLLRGLAKYPLYECKLCNTHNNEINTFTYNGIYEHLLGIHNIKNDFFDDDLIRVNLEAYITVFYKNLPRNIVFDQ